MTYTTSGTDMVASDSEAKNGLSNPPKQPLKQGILPMEKQK